MGEGTSPVSTISSFFTSSVGMGTALVSAWAYGCIRACQLSCEAGADFVKTSTGFSTGGATVSDVALMKKTVGDAVKIKASGGIRTLSDAKAMIEAGADRLGCSASVAIMEQYKTQT